MSSAGNICSVSECLDAFQFNIRVNLIQNIYFALHKAIFETIIQIIKFKSTEKNMNKCHAEIRTGQEVYGKVKGDYLKYTGNITEPRSKYILCMIVYI